MTRERGVLWSRADTRLEARGLQMLYKKINVELIVVADEAEAVVAGVNTALDQLEDWVQLVCDARHSSANSGYA
jgi:hypothetical protein